MTMKYLGAILFTCVLFLFLVFYDPALAFQENFATTTSSNVVSSVNVPNSIVPNVVVPNSVTGTLSDPSVFSSALSGSGNGASAGYVVTSSNVANPGTDASGNATNSASTTCDPSTLYSMKNIMQDKNGNIIVRYMDTCGKYYTYQYTQTIQGPSTVETAAAPAAAVAAAAPAPTTAPPAPPAAAAVPASPPAVDVNTINNLVSNALAAAAAANKSTPTPIVVPT